MTSLPTPMHFTEILLRVGLPQVLRPGRTLQKPYMAISNCHINVELPLYVLPSCLLDQYQLSWVLLLSFHISAKVDVFNCNISVKMILNGHFWNLRACFKPWNFAYSFFYWLYQLPAIISLLYQCRFAYTAHPSPHSMLLICAIFFPPSIRKILS